MCTEHKRSQFLHFVWRLKRKKWAEERKIGARRQKHFFSRLSYQFSVAVVVVAGGVGMACYEWTLHKITRIIRNIYSRARCAHVYDAIDSGTHETGAKSREMISCFHHLVVAARTAGEKWNIKCSNRKRIKSMRAFRVLIIAWLLSLVFELVAFKNARSLRGTCAVAVSGTFDILCFRSRNWSVRQENIGESVSQTS